jgi:hypothetical protein
LAEFDALVPGSAQKILDYAAVNESDGQTSFGYGFMLDGNRWIKSDRYEGG